jgi:hypothetical protein
VGGPFGLDPGGLNDGLTFQMGTHGPSYGPGELGAPFTLGNDLPPPPGTTPSPLPSAPESFNPSPLTLGQTPDAQHATVDDALASSLSQGFNTQDCNPPQMPQAVNITDYYKCEQYVRAYTEYQKQTWAAPCVDHFPVVDQARQMNLEMNLPYQIYQTCGPPPWNPSQPEPPQYALPPGH